MASYLTTVEKHHTGHLHSGFLTCLIALLIIIFSPLNSRAIDIQITDNLKKNQSSLRVQKAFLVNFPGENLFKSSGEISLLNGKKLQFSSTIYTVRKYQFLPEFASALEFNKQKNITGLGIIGNLKWPLYKGENWSININGKVIRAQQHAGPSHQKNRWNFEHQIGWDTNYNISPSLQASLGVYHYRIIKNFHYDNPAQTYISSGGGFASLLWQF
ncbi:MAG: hypothetical protein KAI89_08995 [Emcibacter sp.]|nr:hypothetical protein [Emcibacter sp.]